MISMLILLRVSGFYCKIGMQQNWILYLVVADSSLLTLLELKAVSASFIFPSVCEVSSARLL